MRFHYPPVGQTVGCGLGFCIFSLKTDNSAGARLVWDPHPESGSEFGSNVPLPVIPPLSTLGSSVVMGNRMGGSPSFPISPPLPAPVGDSWIARSGSPPEVDNVKLCGRIVQDLPATHSERRGGAVQELED